MSKAKVIREFLTKNPKATTSEIAKQLKVAPNYVSSLRRKKGRKVVKKTDLKSLLRKEREIISHRLDAIDSLLE